MGSKTPLSWSVLSSSCFGGGGGGGGCGPQLSTLTTSRGVFELFIRMYLLSGYVGLCSPK